MLRDPIHILTIAENFLTSTTPVSVTPVTAGHINDSFFVYTGGKEPAFVLQRINHHIFRNIEGLMSNIVKVLEHLNGKDLAAYGFVPLRVIPDRDGRACYKDAEGDYWRMYNYIPGSVSHDLIGDPKIAREAGKAFGTFQLLTADLSGADLVETIPDFHNIATRLKTFRETAEKDPAGRVQESTPEIRFVEERAETMHAILNLGNAGLIPLRVTHNDTKINNILFNRQDKAICIVDLDTVMPGYSLYDFGDAIRTGASAAAEDEAELSKVDLRMDLYRAYSEGYLSVAMPFLLPGEISHLAFSARFMTYLIGLRFLTDYLDGDHYYRVRHEKHNLSRARAQFALVRKMEERSGQMEQIISQYASLRT
jgi:Ser/Thr protein kinase RdoA (MazF antagonist)